MLLDQCRAGVRGAAAELLIYVSRVALCGAPHFDADVSWSNEGGSRPFRQDKMIRVQCGKRSSLLPFISAGMVKRTCTSGLGDSTPKSSRPALPDSQHWLRGWERWLWKGRRRDIINSSTFPYCKTVNHKQDSTDTMNGTTQNGTKPNGTAKHSCRWPNPALSDSVFKMFEMHGKVSIITGGTGGIGYELAKGLAEAGSDIALWYHTCTAGAKLAAAIERDFGVRCKAYRCDVAVFDQVSSRQTVSFEGEESEVLTSLS